MNQRAKYIGLLAILPLVMVAIAPDFIGEADAVNVGTVDDGSGDRLTMRDTGQSVEKYLESLANKN